MVVEVGAGPVREGYWRVAAPAALRAALEEDEPIVLISMRVDVEEKQEGVGIGR